MTVLTCELGGTRRKLGIVRGMSGDLAEVLEIFRGHGGEGFRPADFACPQVIFHGSHQPQANLSGYLAGDQV